MDSTFLSQENLDNIYDYLNAKVVNQYNINLIESPFELLPNLR